MGCYGDNITRDAVFQSISSTSNMTAGYCTSTCSNRGYSYGMVQNGDECWCSNGYGVYGTLPMGIGGSGCNKTCTGNSSQNCGGPYASVVYNLCPAIQFGSYLGCWNGW